MMCDEVSDMSIEEALAALLLLLLDGAKRFGKEYTESIKCKVTYWIETNHRFYGLLEAVSSWESCVIEYYTEENRSTREKSRVFIYVQSSPY